MSLPLAEELKGELLAGLTDSKQLRAAQRERYYRILITHPAISYARGMVCAAEIDRINILSATHLAMRRALEALPLSADIALVDGLPVRGLGCASRAIVKGDSKSLLIAAASIIAKVSRDHHMLQLDRLYPQYDFAGNKGYGVNGHLAALFEHGSCREHRHTFRPVRDVDQRLPGFEF